MKIACVAYLHGAGGAEKQIIMLANALSAKGNELHLIILAESNIKYEILDSIKQHDLSYIETSNGNRIINRFKCFKNKLKEIKPDVTINFWLQSAYFCSLLPKSITGKTIYSERGDPGDSEYRGILGIVRTLSFYRIDGFVFQSEGARDYFSKRIKNNSVIIHNPVIIPDGKFDSPCSNRVKKIVTVGRLHTQKNQKLLIDAFYNISNDFPDFILEIYGDGELKKELLNRITSLDLGNKVFLKGTKNNILDYIYPSTLFILSSNYEGLPNSLMEAMALGIPCISTDCDPGGPKSLFKEYKYGFLVGTDNVDDLTSKLKYALNYDYDSSILFEDSLKFKINHSPEKLYNEWFNYIDSL